MLEDLLNLVKGHAQDAVVNNPDVPNEHNDAVIADATHSIASGFQNAIAGGGGGLQNILSLFSGGANNQGSMMSNPIVSSVISGFAGNLMSKFGIGGDKANGIAASLIPTVMNSLVNKTNDPNNSSFTLDHLLHSITGGQSTQVAQDQQASGNTGFSFQNLISQFTGGGNAQAAGGSTGSGLMDIVSKLAGGAQSQQQAGGGGIMDIIKKFM